MVKYRESLYLALTLALVACGPFEFSPYTIRPEESERGLTAANLARLAAQPADAGPFSFAVVSDPQGRYDELAGAVRRINTDTSIRLVVMTGDLTQSGLLQEFHWVAERMERLAAPWLTVLGNHDALGNGVAVYGRMFGPLDYSLVYRGHQLVFFNDNAWHFTAVPDLAWIEERLGEAGDSLGIITFAHIPPYGDQLEDSVSRAMVDLFEKRRVKVAVFGHNHHYHYGKLYGGDVDYVITDDVGSRNYVKVTVGAGGPATVERVFY